jgi:ABC-2 type transport system permease protein
VIAVAADTGHMLVRQLRKQKRLRVWWVIMVSAPLCWLLLYGQLFDRVIRLPGAREGSYVAFLAPGLVVMTAFSWSLWSGMTIVRDVDRGLVESFLATPLRPVALVLANVLRWALVSVMQTTIIVTAGHVVGFRIASGPPGWVVVFAAAALTAGSFAAASNAIALLVMQEETLSAVLSFLSLPLMFLSAALIDPAVMPAWMRGAVGYNPVDWGVVAARGATAADPDWAHVASRLGLLAAFGVVAVLAALGALRAYRRAL